MVPEVVCIHRAPGRFRLRLASGKATQSSLERMQEQLSRCQVVNSVSTNPVTGSILVLHKGEQAVINYAEKHNIFRISKEKRADLGHATLETYRKVDKGIKTISSGQFDLPHAAFLALLGTGVFQIARGRIGLPAWYTAFWYAFNIFNTVHQNKYKSR